MLITIEISLKKHIRIFNLSILLGALFLLPKGVYCQNPDGDDGRWLDGDIEVDSSARTRKHYPKVAAISSAVVPGLGQIYNRKHWKAPLIWGGSVAIYAMFDHSNSYYHRYKRASEQYNENRNVEDVTDSELRSRLEENASTGIDNINYWKDTFRRDRDWALILGVLLYVGNIVDAVVDAHLLDYDISKDLSLQVAPTIIPSNLYTSNSTTYGLNVKLRF